VSGPVLHVVGAGVAGLAAALAGARQGRTVLLHEATGQAGGRCRSVEDDATGSTHDNGTHVLLGANRAALGFLDEIGASDLWVEPEPAGLPIVDLDAPGVVALVALSPWSWLSPGRRPPGLGLGDLARLALLALPGLPDRPVAEVMGAGPFARAVIEPLTVAGLNTPPAEASARRLRGCCAACCCPAPGGCSSPGGGSGRISWPLPSRPWRAPGSSRPTGGGCAGSRRTATAPGQPGWPSPTPRSR
jgi:hypothetical protein